MKIKTLILVCFSLLFGNAMAQTVPASIRAADTVNVAFQNKMEDMFENVDLSLVPNGMLYDHGFPFIAMEPFRGVITDSSTANTLSFGLVYASLTSMAVDNSKVLPSPDDYMTVMDTTTINSAVIPIVGLHQEYYQIDPLAVSDGLFTVAGDNLTDVLPRPRSPYLKKEAFMLAPATDRTNQMNPSFFIDSALFYTNTGKTVDSLLMDKGNGQGYAPVFFNQNIPVNFVTEGPQKIKLKIVYTDASRYETHFDLNVHGSLAKDISDSPDIIHPIYPSGTNAGGLVNVFLACGHERIEKPFIWAEAFNPSIGFVETNLLPVDILGRMNHEIARVDEKSLLDYLTENGYDIIILDYADGAAALPHTAEFIKESIDWVNTEKHSAGSNAKNIILGQSMGGVATMQALKEMENDEEGPDHECEKFIVFDSPINGANIPLAAQGSLLDMATLWVNKPYSSDDHFLFEYAAPVADLLKTLFAPATRTMIRQQSDAIDFGILGTGTREFIADELGLDIESKFDEYYSDLHDPTNGGMPTDCEVLVIANGSNAGASGKQPFEPGDLILHADIDHMVIGAIAAQLIEDMDEFDPFDSGVWSSVLTEGSLGIIAWLAAGAVDIDIQFYAVKNQPDFTFYKNHIDINPWWTVSPIVFHGRTLKTSNAMEIDHTPGGFFGDGVNGIFFSEVSVFNEALSTFKMHTYCFTPTGSVLNYRDGSGNTWEDNTLRAYTNPSADLTAGLMPGVDSYFAFNGTVTYGNDPAGGSYRNTAHTWFREDQTKYLLYHLVGSDELDGLTSLTGSQSFNYGITEITPATDYEGTLPTRTKGVLETSITVSNTQFNVNSNQRIGLTPSPYAPEELGFAKSNSHFVLNLGPVCDDPSVVLTLENATMDLGDGNTRTATVLVGEGHEIVVGNGSTLTIKSGSTLKLSSLGSLRIQSGGTVIIEDNASLITDYGSRLHYANGAAIQLNGGNSLLKLVGELFIAENANFKPTHVGFGSGTIEIGNPDGTIIAGTNSQFTILGDNENDPYLKLLEEGKLVFPSIMDRAFIGTCQVVFRSEIGEPIQSFTDFFTTNATYVVQDNTEALSLHPVVGLYDKAYLQNNSFEDVRFYADQMEAEDGAFLTVRASDFNFSYAKDDPFIHVQSGTMLIDVCDFTNYRYSALKLMGLTAYSSVINSTFTADPLASGEVIFVVNENELYLRKNRFDGGRVGVHSYLGQLTLKCNEFNNQSNHGLWLENLSSVEMSVERKVGYNKFNNIAEENIITNYTSGVEMHKGYNSFLNTSSYPLIYGSVSFTQPFGVVYSMNENQWNNTNSAPAVSDINLFTAGTPDEIDYSFDLMATGSPVCGQYDPSGPPVYPAEDAVAEDLPVVFLPGAPPGGMRLDSAVQFALASTKIWSPTNTDLDAIDYFSTILTTQFSPQETQLPETQYFLRKAYTGLKYTVGYAITDSTILKSNNTTSFDTTVQKYVDVLNYLTKEDTIKRKDYRERFSLELDKANLYRMLGHTNQGYKILDNMSKCELDSNERVTLNQIMLIYDEERIKQFIGEEAYRFDTTFVNPSSYQTPASSQATEFYFGSVITDPLSVTLRSCMSAPSHSIQVDGGENGNLEFKVYPNPTTGLINVTYTVPDEMEGNIVVYGVNGQTIYQSRLPNGTGIEQMDLSSAQSGLYIYTVLIDGAVEYSGRISIVK